MHATLYLPGFHLQAMIRDCPELADRPVALLDESAADLDAKARGKAPIIELTEAARKRGVVPGMTATQGQARYADLHLCYRCAEDEDIARELLLEVASNFTPDFEYTGPGICTLDLFGSPWARKAKGKDESDNSLAHRFGETANRTLATHQLHARIGIADNPDLALLAAKLAHPEPVCVIRGTSDDIRTFLAPLSVSALEPSGETAAILDLWGIRTLGDLAALPREAATERLGSEAIRLRSLANGGKPRPLKLVRPPRDFSQDIDLDYEVDTLEPLLFALRRMLGTLTARLSAAWLVAGRVTLTLRFSDGSAYQRDFRIPEPSRDPELLFRVLHTHLEDFSAQRPITGVALEAGPARAGAHQFHLFDSSLRDPNRFAETLGRLEALLGPDHVGRPECVPDHRPDSFDLARFSEKEVGDTRKKKKKKTKQQVGDPVLPIPLEALFRIGPRLRRFRPPIAIDVRVGSGRRPVEIVSGPICGELRSQRGPWFHSGGWWEKKRQWASKEWDIQLEDGSLCRLAEGASGNWMLEGVYD